MPPQDKVEHPTPDHSTYSLNAAPTSHPQLPEPACLPPYQYEVRLDNVPLVNQAQRLARRHAVGGDDGADLAGRQHRGVRFQASGLAVHQVQAWLCIRYSDIRQALLRCRARGMGGVGRLWMDGNAVAAVAVTVAGHNAAVL